MTQDISTVKLMLDSSDEDATGFTGYGYDGNESGNVLMIGQGPS